MKHSNDNIALITGAASGLGRLAAVRWVQAGGIAVCLDRDQAGLTSLRSEVGDGVVTHAVDVSAADAVAKIVSETETELGPIKRVDHAAGIFPTDLATNLSAEQITEVMAINYGGTVNVCQAVLPAMIKRRQGVLVNYASIAGLVPMMHMSAYCASKAACIAYTETLYHETRNCGVQVVCLCPPMVDTPLLHQATSNPQVLTKAKPMSADVVLDKLERAIARNRFWCLPSMKAKLIVAARKYCPRLLWFVYHRIEGV